LHRRTRLQPPRAQPASFPSWNPVRALDHVLCAGFEVLSYRTMAAAGSDHLAIAVEVAAC
jgi:endonuclease/exonuclease/phosphatase family metal-dependent hydrolase